MNISNIRRTLSAALSGLALVVVGQISDAASDVKGETQMAAAGESVRSAPPNAMEEPRRDAHPSPLTLYVEDPSGNAFRLVHIEGTGWKYAEGWNPSDHAGQSLLRRMAFWSTGPTPSAKQAIGEEPLTVLIDGPSGFTFVWNRDDGWKFVGKITEKRP